MTPSDEPNDATVGALLAWAQARLRRACIEAPRREARLLLAWALGAAPADRLRSASDELVQASDYTRFISAVHRREAREPLAYITGRQGFWTLDLEVSDATLIPRADSEAVIELLRHLRPDRAAVSRVLDLGTGTGCLLLAALSEYPQAWGVGIDISARAAALASRNAAANGLESRARFVCGSWSDPLGAGLPGSARRGFDLVLSNPPYIPAADLAGLMPEVARFEPATALDGGVDGLDAYRTILRRLPELLSIGGIAIFELGVGQADAVAALAAGLGLAAGPTHMDFSGTVRTVAIRRA